MSSYQATEVQTHQPAMRRDRPSCADAVPAWLVLPAAMLFWIQPKRLGAPLAASGWRLALTGYLFALVTAFGLTVWADSFAEFTWCRVPGYVPAEVQVVTPNVASSEVIRAPYASLISVIHHDSSSGVSSLLTWAGLVGLTGAGVLASALLLLPWAAAGEPLGRLFGRCLRLAMWSSTIAIPYTVSRLLLPLAVYWWTHQPSLDAGGFIRPQLFIEGTYVRPDQSADWVGHGLKAACLLWYLFVLLRSGVRYAGPVEGPAWQPRRTRCCRCEYILSGLPRSGQCPECGTAVAESIAAMETSGRFTHWRAFKLSVRAALSRGRAEG